ncbi:protamine-like [Culex pipiens pallens]|uniref:protamine-like n=1 Tax=Culex pipiens pallens TaxID=42434 RepID=UPI001954F5FF|nr:protamine-like [Culex pipiens pallens]
MDSQRDSKRSGGRSCNPGRRSRNPYINFLRDFRRSHCGLRPVEVIRQGAQAWGRLTEEQRLPYIRESFYHPLRRRPCRPAARMASRRRSGMSSRTRKSSGR